MNDGHPPRRPPAARGVALGDRRGRAALLAACAGTAAAAQAGDARVPGVGRLRSVHAPHGYRI